MKAEKWGSCLTAALLAFFLGFGAVASMATGFGMHLSPDAPEYIDTVAWLPVNFPTIALCCGSAAVVFAVCCTGRLGLVPLGLLALGGGYLWFEGSLALSAEALTTRITQVYNSAYGWPVINWSGQSLSDTDMTLALCALGIVIAGAVAWTVCRRGTCLPAVLLAALPVFSCMVVTDRVPETVYLFAFLLGCLVLVFSQTLRRQNAGEGNLLAAMVTVPGTLLLLGLFYFIPQQDFTLPDDVDALFSALEQQLTENGNTQSILGYGVSSQGKVALDTMGVRLSVGTKVMSVTADSSGTVYLRGRAYDFYEGTHWASSSQADYLGWPGNDMLERQGSLTVTTEQTHQDMYVPYYYYGMDYADLRQNVTNREKLTTYTYSYGMLSYQKAEQRAKNSKGYGPEYTVLPDSTRRWAQALLGRLELDQGTTLEIAQKIGDYVRSSAQYDTWTRRMPDSKTDFARWFLQESDTGYCVHFASAAAVLLKAAKIPARYVTGYMVQTKAGETVTVRQSDAHAWVEYWLRGVGWVILEATPSAAAEDTWESETTEAPQTEPVQTVLVSPTQEVQTDPVPDSPEAPRQTGPFWLWSVPLLLVLAVVVQWRLRVTLRHRRYRQGSCNARAVACWVTLRELASLLGQRPPKALFDLAQKARFSQHTLEPSELAELEAVLSGTLDKLKKQPLYKRLYYRLVLAIW